MSDRHLFHLAIPIGNTERAKQFYCKGLGCQVGRENRSAIIFNFFDHQLVAHVIQESLQPQASIYPRHFGLVFAEKSDWDAILTRAKTQQLTFREEEKLRFPGQLTEHYTFFLEDPFYNLLEFKFYQHSEAIFGGRELTDIGDR